MYKTQYNHSNMKTMKRGKPESQSSFSVSRDDKQSIRVLKDQEIQSPLEKSGEHSTQKSQTLSESWTGHRGLAFHSIV